MDRPRTTVRAKLARALVTAALAAVAVVSVGHSSAMLGADAADRQVAAARSPVRVPIATVPCPKRNACGGGRRN
jgi:hypothetical protein